MEGEETFLSIVTKYRMRCEGECFEGGGGYPFEGVSI